MQSLFKHVRRSMRVWTFVSVVRNRLVRLRTFHHNLVQVLKEGYSRPPVALSGCFLGQDHRSQRLSMIKKLTDFFLLIFQRTFSFLCGRKTKFAPKRGRLLVRLAFIIAQKVCFCKTYPTLFTSCSRTIPVFSFIFSRIFPANASISSAVAFP